MRFDLITIFPEFFAGPLDHGIVRRAREAAWC
jgi:tRNA G37 N-methylase TrmD